MSNITDVAAHLARQSVEMQPPRQALCSTGCDHKHNACARYYEYEADNMNNTAHTFATGADQPAGGGGEKGQYFCSHARAFMRAPSPKAVTPCLCNLRVAGKIEGIESTRAHRWKTKQCLGIAQGYLKPHASYTV